VHPRRAQIECTTLTPYSVLKASGHVDRFEDLMVRCQRLRVASGCASPAAEQGSVVASTPPPIANPTDPGRRPQVKDVKTGECYRADKLLEDFVDNKLTREK
jgi:glycyl-tRNA synthetase (class II)